MTNSRRDVRLSVRAGAALAAVLFCGAATAAPPPSRQTFVVTEFDTVRLEAPIEVVLTSGKGSSAVATGDRDMLDDLDLNVSGLTLTIRLRDAVMLGGQSEKTHAPTRIVLTTTDLRRAIVLGAGSLSVDRLKAAAVEATLRGSGMLRVGKVEADRTVVIVFGSGSLAMAGATLDMTAAISGSGRFDGSALDARRTTVDMQGSSDVQVTARETAHIVADGTGRLVAAGKPQCVVRKTGNASVTCAGESY